MKPILALNMAVFTLLISSFAAAGTIGQAQIVGNGCVTEDSVVAMQPVAGYANRYTINQTISLSKTVTEKISRKICNFSVPVKLNSGEKLVVSNAAQWVRMSASKATEVKMSQEIFLAGSKGEPLTAQIKGVGGLAYSSKTLRASGVVAESACGKDTIVRGNLSAVAIGERRATAQSGALQLTMAIVPCE